MIRVNVDIKATLRAIPILAKQVSWATAQAINDVAFIARDAARSNVQAAMTIRRPWVLQGIQVARPFSTPANPTAIVKVEQRRGFLWKFEQGIDKTPTQGKALAVPEDDFFPRSGLVPPSKKPKTFDLTKHVTRLGKVQVKGNRRTFVLNTRRGAGIFQRVGRGRGKSSVRLLYWFVRKAEIDPILRLAETVRTVVTRAWPHRFADRLTEALRTARW